MTQYPPQYQTPYPPPPPPPGFYGAADPLAPAKRAGILSIVLGGMMLLCGVCSGAASFVSFDQLPPEIRQEYQQHDEQIRAQHGVGLHALALSFGIILLVPAILLIILGLLVRRGGLGSVITLMVLSALLGLFLLVQIGISLLRGAADPRNLIASCVLVIPLALLGLLVWYLVSAARSATAVRAMQSQYQQQYWQQQFNQQTYAQGGYVPPPPPPPPPINQ